MSKNSHGDYFVGAWGTLRSIRGGGAKMFWHVYLMPKSLYAKLEKAIGQFLKN